MPHGPPLHDPLAVAALLPDAKGTLGYVWEEGCVEVVLSGAELGRTVFVHRDLGDAGINAHGRGGGIEEGGLTVLFGSSGVKIAGVRVKVGRRVDVEAFWRVIWEAVKRADEVSPLNRYTRIGL